MQGQAPMKVAEEGVIKEDHHYTFGVGDIVKNKNQSSSKNTQDKYVVGDGDWEIASDQDIKSGNYNIE